MPDSKLQRYEYRIQTETVEPVDFEAKALNYLAKEGWELVSVCGPQNTPCMGLRGSIFFDEVSSFVFRITPKDQVLNNSF
jgi:hypothetical protein